MRSDNFEPLGIDVLAINARHALVDMPHHMGNRKEVAAVIGYGLEGSPDGIEPQTGTLDLACLQDLGELLADPRTRQVVRPAIAELGQEYA